MMAEIKYFDEILISSIIRYIDLTSPMEHIYFTRELVDNLNKPRKEFLVKFENEEEESIIFLSDIPFRIWEGYAFYEILHQTSYGRFYAHENQKLNSVKFPTIYKDFIEFDSVYKNRPIKKVKNYV